MRAAGIRPEVRDGILIIERPETIDAALLAQIREHEAEIVEFLLAARQVRCPAAHDEDGPVPLTHAQSGILFMDKLFERSCLFNVHTEIDIRGPLDLRSLLRALGHVLSSHPVLTAHVAERDGGAEWVESKWTLDEIVRVVDLDGALLPSQYDGFLQELADHEKHWVFNGGSAWLRATIVRFTSTVWVLTMCRHHIASDGWSFAVISREVQNAYRRIRQGLPPERADPRLFWSYCRFMQRADRDLRGIQYWLSQLAGAPREIRLPKRGVVSGRVTPASLLRFEVARDSFAALTKHKITGYAALLAVVACAIHQECNERELCIGTDVTTRDRPEWERVVGMFVNRLVLRLVVNGRDTVLDYLLSTQQVVSAALAWRHTSLDRVARRLGVPGETGLFNVIFGLHNNPHEDFTLDDSVECRVRDGGVPVTELDLSVYFTAMASVFRGVLSYREGVFERSWVQSLADRICFIAGSIGSNLAESVGTLLERARPVEDADALLAQRWQSLYRYGSVLSFTEAGHEE